MKSVINILISLAIGVVIGLNSNKLITAREAIDVDTKIDTVYVPKIINVPHPILVEVRPIYEKKDTLPITELIDDTTAIVNIPITQAKYEGIKDSTEYTAWVSGYEPKLDSLKFKYNNVFIDKETTTVVTKQSKSKLITWGIQAGFGYGLIGRKPDLFVGAGVQINF